MENILTIENGNVKQLIDEIIRLLTTRSELGILLNQKWKWY